MSANIEHAIATAQKCFDGLDKLEQRSVLPKDIIDCLRRVTAAMLTELVIHDALGNLKDESN